MQGSTGIIFVVDATNNDRFTEARQELWKHILNTYHINHIPILVLVNKQDLPNARSTGEVARALELHKITNRPFAILPTSAVSGFNLNHALDWLSQRIIDLMI